MSQEKKEIGMGDRIPEFTIHNQDGTKKSSLDLLGKKTVLYFYPKDDTPGCTKEACSFQDSLTQFQALHTSIIGISPDSHESHMKFIKKYNLTFELISDADYAISSLFGVLRNEDVDKRPSLIRATFVIDEEGRIIWMEKPVRIEGHVSRVQNALHSK